MSEKSISLDGVHEQLVDINNGSDSFDAVIIVTPTAEDMDKNYNIGIGTQSQIDNKKDISFSSIKGIYKKTFSHTPVVPGGEPDVFYLIMSSQSPINNIKVMVDVRRNTPPSPPPPQQQPHYHPQPTVVEQFQQPKTTTYVKYFLAVVIVSVGAYFLYKFWKKSQSDKQSDKQNDKIPTTVQIPAPTTTLVHTPTTVQTPTPTTIPAAISTTVDVPQQVRRVAEVPVTSIPKKHAKFTFY